jgi:DNA-binding NarL/FixJ family response regulator
VSLPTIKVLCVDDHALIREGVGYMLEFEQDLTLVGTAHCGADALEKFDLLRPDVTIMDLRLPDMHGSDVIRRIREKHPTAKIIALTTFASDVQAVRALRSGAVSYLLKSALRTELLTAIRATFAGERKISAEVAENIAAYLLTDPLSEREVEVLQAVSAGCSNKAVAAELRVSEETVRAHMKSAFVKLGAADRTQAVVIAMRRGYIAV